MNWGDIRTAAPSLSTLSFMSWAFDVMSKDNPDPNWMTLCLGITAQPKLIQIFSCYLLEAL